MSERAAPKKSFDFDPVRAAARERDPRGHAVHAWFAAAAAAFMTGPTSYAEFALVPVFVYTLLRLWVLGDALLLLARRALPVLLIVFAAWLLAGILWTDAPRSVALDEPGNLRWCIAIAMFWPVLDRRGLIVGGLVFGLALGQLAQLYHGLGELLGFETPFDRFAGRVSGWWDPAVAGGVLTVALGLQLPSALMGQGRARWVAIGLAMAAAIGLAATGSRGGWLAAMGMVFVGLVVAIRTGKGRNAALVCIAAGVLGAGVAAATPAIRDRVSSAFEQVSASVEEGDYSGDVGARLAMAVSASHAFASSPIVGVGTAGYAAWAQARSEADLPLHDHAHNTWLHLAACNGIVGVGLFGAVFVFAFRGSIGWAKDAIGSARAGPLFALIGLAFFSLFDTLHASQQTAAMLAALFALSMRGDRE